MRKEEMEFYVSPNVKIVEIKTSQILCGSNESFSSGNNYGEGYWN